MKQHFYILLSACGISLCLVTATSTVRAQSIKIDGTTPTTPATCSGTCNIGGGLQRGSNLFHSFSQFNVDAGARVIFVDPGVRNILTRVTGNDPSNILGTLGVSGGRANLFLINPNGIIFGENAKLDIGGSFVGTTANAIRFGNQGFFRASASEVPLLTVNPSALFYQSANGSIENRSNNNQYGLRVPDGQSLLLVGGEVNLNGGILNAFGGRVELGGLAQKGEIGLDVDNNNLRLSFPENTALADVFLTNGARVDVTTNGGGSITFNAGNITISGDKTRLLSSIKGGRLGAQAGDITLNATGVVTVDASQIFNVVQPEAQGNSGNININAGSLSLSNGGQLVAATYGKGNAGNLNIDVGNGVVTVDASQIFNVVQPEAQGNSGNININAGSLSLSNGGQLVVATYGKGNAGNLNIDVGQGTVTLVDGNSSLYSSVASTGIGNGGDIKITAKELFLRDGGFVNTGTYGVGNAGNILVRASDLVSLESESVINTGIFSNVAVGAVGNAGEINIKTPSLSLSGGVQIGASVFGNTLENPESIGHGGNILVNADSVTISGASLDTGFSSGLLTLTDQGAEGAAGNITVNTRDFRITDGATLNAQTRNSSRGGNVTINATTFEAINGGQVLTTASNSGNAGNISVNADSITLSGKDPNFNNRSKQFGNIVQNQGDTSGLFATTRNDSTASGGNISIVTEQLILQDQAQVSVSSNGKGDAGNLDINAHNITLDNQAKLTSESASGHGGDITLQVQDLLLMRHNSQISTDAGIVQTFGDGGNITINVPSGFIVAVPSENSDITANAYKGNGGRVDITTRGLFGIQSQKSNTHESDITASSQFGLNGTVQINSPDVDPTKGLVQLPINLVDASQQIVADCNSGGKIGRSSFIATGRGGLVDDPTQPLIADDAVIADWITLSPEIKNRADAIQKRAVVHKQPNTEQKLQKLNSVNQPTQIVEAQGWLIDANGNVVLVAQLPTITPHNSSLTSTSCLAH
ncbi:S-layer family protein [Nostoc sp.]|uniref:S-layer family protein n=1 Tax=Nostoc sp. TaxID=1180 RepID=UPI002FFC8BE0